MLKLSTGDYQTAERMTAKLRVVPIPAVLDGLTVLDVGCDHGAFCWLAADRGASRVVGVDRGRNVRGAGFVDLAARNRVAGLDDYPQCEFHRMELGAQYHQLGRFDLVLMLNCYHHAYQATGGDHSALWFWLWRHTRGELLWENPVSLEDPVAAQHVTFAYRETQIREAAEQWFDIEVIGRGHVATRVVWRCTPKPVAPTQFRGVVRPGAGGASKAFAYRGGRRIGELEDILGIRAYPGSLNVHLETPFDWERAYYRSRVLDVVDRAKGLEGEWLPRSVRLYPVAIGGTETYVFRFEGESYPERFVELVAGERLRDLIPGPTIELEH